MSVNARLIWIIPALLVASWLAVRSLSASPAHQRDELGDPPAPFASLATSREVRDPALTRLIGSFAAQARRK
jgi:hypothetical protein